MFACDTGRDMRYAEAAAKEYEIPHFASTLNEVVDFLKEGADEAVDRMESPRAEAS